MRIPRSIQLSDPEGYVHKFWRSHNREYSLLSDKIKSLYLRCLKIELLKKGTKEFLKLYAYCVMDNHAHELNRYLESSRHLSSYMRRSHGRFGRIFNNLFKRSGKVAEGRPKTPQIQDLEHLIMVHFYVEANPVRAKKIPIEKLKQYKYSSFRFYAYGIRDEFTEMLTIPDWYIALGKSAKDRQRAYRRLFMKYLKSKGIEPHGFMKLFIGSPDWAQSKSDQANEEVQRRCRQVESSNNTS